MSAIRGAFGVAGSLLKYALLTLGVLALVSVAAVWWFFSGWFSSSESVAAAPVKIEARQEVAKQVEKKELSPMVAAADASREIKNYPVVVSDPACVCSSGLICVGSRGGRYCLTDAGNKKYLSKDK